MPKNEDKNKQRVPAKQKSKCSKCRGTGFVTKTEGKTGKPFDAYCTSCNGSGEVET